MTTKVTLEFVTPDSASYLQRFLDDIIKGGMLNSGDNEEGYMITVTEVKYRTELSTST